MTLSRIALAMASTLALGALAAPPVAPAAPAKKIEITLPSDLKYAPPPGFPADAPGPRIAILWGDPQKGPVGFILKQPAGTSSGVHSHDADYQAVVIQGEVTATVTEDKTAPGVGPGGFWKQPGKEWHSNTCKSAVDCISYIEFLSGGISFTPKDAPRAPPAKKTK